MDRLTQQRLHYLIEHGGLYPHDEAATKNFVLKWCGAILLLNLVQTGLMLYPYL